MRLLSTLFIVFFAAAAIAQTPVPGNCGLDYEEGLELREQMFRNRNLIPQSTIEALQQQRFTIYIPVVVHLVGNSNRQGFAQPQGILSMLCRLNNDFANQNLQFYIKDSIRYVIDDTIFADAYDSIAVDRMIALKDTTALNIFTNSSAGGGVAGYYSRRGDYVFMLNSYANGGSTTITHEVGHFFTLPHTFFGWENIDARQLYGNSPAPDSIGSSWRRREVEYVARTGPLANCYSSGDGFCDTDADYISGREQCPMPGQALDPSGVAITPNTRLYMSYFYDACVDSFSTEQKTAIMSSVVNRNWLFFPAPITTNLSWSNIAPVQPLDAAILPKNGVDSIRLEWNTQGVGPATAWVIQVERMLFGSPIATLALQIVHGQNHFDLPTASLLSGATYRWSVMPFSNAYHCAGFSPFSQFSIETASGLNIAEAPVVIDLALRPNPIQGATASIFFNISEPMMTSLRLYSIDGRLILNEPLQYSESGEHTRYLNLSQLTSGVYHLQLFTEKGTKMMTLVVR